MGFYCVYRVYRYEIFVSQNVSIEIALLDRNTINGYVSD